MTRSDSFSLRALLFNDFLSQLPPDKVFGRLLPEGAKDRRILSTAYLKKLTVDFAQPEALSALFASLPQEVKRFISLVYLTGKRGLLLGAVDQSVAQALETFLVYAARIEGSGYRVWGFSEFFRALQPQIEEILAAASVVVEEIPAGHELAWHCANDIAMLCGLAAQGSLRINKNGTINKTSIELIDQLLCRVILSRRTKAGLPSAEIIAEALIAFCRNKKLLLFTDDAVEVDACTVSDWLGQSATHLQREIVDFLVRHAGGWNLDPLQKLSHADQCTAISLSLFAQSTHRQILPDLVQLCYAGVLQMRQTGDGPVFWSPRQVYLSDEQQHAQTPRTITVLPDFTAIAQCDISPEQLYWLSSAARIVSFDQVYHAVLEKQIIIDSLARGIEPERFWQLLTEWKAPANVIETVKEWSREFFRLCVTDQAILLSGDAATTRQLLATPQVAALLHIQQAHTVFLVQKGAQARLLAHLAQIGFDTRMPQYGSARQNETDSLSAQISSPPPAIEILTDFSSVELTPAVDTSRHASGKYGPELKELDLSDTLHVIEYALLMGNALIVDYAGNPGLRKGQYKISPVSLQGGTNPTLSAQSLGSGSEKAFTIKLIKRIGVLPPCPT